MAVEISGDTTPALAADFWRQAGSATLLPDGTTDESEGINRSGKVGIGSPQGRTPVATLDVQSAGAGRSGTDRRNPGDPFFLTGTIAGGPGLTAPAAFGSSADVKGYVGHSNQSQGFAFGFQAIQKAGGGHFILGKDDPQGQYGVHWFGRHSTTPGAFWNWVREGALANVDGWSHRYFANGAQEAGDQVRRRTDLVGGGLAVERFIANRQPNGTLANVVRQTWSGQNPNTPAFDVNPNNIVGDRLLTLWGDASSPAGSNVYSIGIRSSELVSLAGSGGSHTWRRSNDGVLLFSISNVGRVTAPLLPTSPAGLPSGSLWRDVAGQGTLTNVVRMVP